MKCSYQPLTKVSDVPSRDRLKRSQYSGYQFLLKEKIYFHKSFSFAGFFFIFKFNKFFGNYRIPVGCPRGTSERLRLQPVPYDNCARIGVTARTQMLAI